MSIVYHFEILRILLIMSKLIENSITIYEAMEYIEQGKYVMPAFQRQYVWNMEQIEKLWDSILLDYPIATFLFWHVDEYNTTWDTYFCNFLKTVTFDNKKQADNINYELSSIKPYISDTAILDGQQRLTSLYLSLFGTSYIREKHARRKTVGGIKAELVIELNNKVSTEEEYNNKKFDIKFNDKIGQLSATQFEIKKLINPMFKNKETRESVICKAIQNIPNDNKEYAHNILNKLCSKIYDEKLIRYTEILDMKQDDALEMFVRFNSGGKALKPSEITMSILEAYWPSARTEFGKLLTHSFEDFSTDFIIRTALMLFGNVEKTNINKQIAEDLKNNWDYLKIALMNLKEFLDDVKINISRFSGSWNVLIPLIFSIYYNHEYKQDYKAMKTYLIRAVLFNFFQAGTKGKLQKLKKKISEYNYKITIDMLDDIYDFKVTDSKIEDILNSEKGSRMAGEALYYLSHNWLNISCKYEQDHLHPCERFSDDNRKPIRIKFDEWKEWKGNRNRLPNLHLLEGRSNASKSAMPLLDYVNDMNQEQKRLFYEHSFVRPSISLEFDNFGRFYTERKKLLAEKIKELVE